MKVSLAAIVLLGVTFLADTVAASSSNNRALRGQLQKNKNAPIRRRRVKDVSNLSPNEAQHGLKQRKLASSIQLIWAYGYSSTIGYHANRSSIYLDLSSSSVTDTKLTDGYTLRHQVNEIEGTISMELTYEGNAWVAVGLSTDGKMAGSDGVM